MLSMFQWWWGLVSASSSVIRLECPPSTDPASPSIPPRTGSTGSTCSPHLPSLIRVEHRRFLSLTASLKLHASSQSSWFVTRAWRGGCWEIFRVRWRWRGASSWRAADSENQVSCFHVTHAAFKDVLVSSSDVRAVICSDWSISVTLGSAGLSVTEGNGRRSLTSAPFKLKFWPHFLWRLHTWSGGFSILSHFTFPSSADKQKNPSIFKIYLLIILFTWRMKAPDWLLETSDTSCDVYLFECWDERWWLFTETSSCVSAVAVRLFIEFCSLLFSIFFSWLKHLFIVLMKTNKDALFTFVHHVLTWTTFDLLCAENQLISEIWFTGKYVLVPKVPTDELEH